MCDCFYLHGQSGGCDWAPLSSCSPSTLLDCEPPIRPVPCDWAVRVDGDVMWLAVGFDKHLYFCIGFSSWSIHGNARLTVGLELNWTFCPVPYLLDLCEAAHVLDWLFSLSHPWLASCQSTPLSSLTASRSGFLGFFIALKYTLTFSTVCLVSMDGRSCM